MGKKTALAAKSAAHNTPLLTEQELAEYLNQHCTTTAIHRRRGLLPYLKIGKNIRYDLSAVLEHIGRAATEGSK